MPKSVKTAEDAAKVPLDQPLDIDLSVPVEPEVLAKEVAPPKIETTPEPEPPVEQEVKEPEINPLQKRLEELERAERANAERYEADKRALQHQHEQELSRQRGDLDQARYESILTAIAASQAEKDAAAKDLSAAIQQQDAALISEAIARQSRAEVRLTQLEDGRASFEARQEAAKKAPPKPEPTAAHSDPFESVISALPDSAKKWLRDHREYVTDGRKNDKIKALHWDVIDEGHEAFSPQYFDSMESHLGLKQAAGQPQRSPPVSAPPTRDVPSARDGQSRPSRITLTPAQREHAKLAGIDEVTYAKGVQEMENRRKNGNLQIG